MNVGDTVYVAIGPDGNHNDDGFTLDFAIMRESIVSSPAPPLEKATLVLEIEPEQTEVYLDGRLANFTASKFESFTATWEHRKFAPNDGEKHKIGCYFHGSKGTFHMGWRDGWTFYPANPNEATVYEKAQLQEPDGHNLKLLWADFLDAIAKGRAPAADIERAHRSTCMSLLGMLSYKLGRSVRWDGAKEQIIGDAAASQLLSRKYRAPWEYPGV